MSSSNVFYIQFQISAILIFFNKTDKTKFYILSQSYALFFFFNDTATTEIYPLSLHDALPISVISRQRQAQGRPLPLVRRAPRRPLLGNRRAEPARVARVRTGGGGDRDREPCRVGAVQGGAAGRDRKSTRLNSSHDQISYAVFC